MRSIKLVTLLLVIITLTACSPSGFLIGKKATKTPTLRPARTPTLKPQATKVLSTKTPIGNRNAGNQLNFPLIIARSPLTVVHTTGDLYQLQPGTPQALPDFLHPDLACKWMGVGGQVFLKDRRSVIGLVVEVTGKLNNQIITFLGLTGNAPEIGPGGYEIRLADYPIATTQALRLRLLDLSGNTLSDPVTFQTYDDCQRNLILINFSHGE